jgi:RNA polymerase sigma factor FliA
MDPTLTDQGRDTDAALNRFHSALPLVERIARGIGEPDSGRLTLDDLLGVGREALLDAARTFDEALGVPFEAWARLRIRGAIVDALRQFSVTREHERRLAKVVHVFAEPPPHPDELVSRAQVARAVSEAVARLPRKERTIVEAHDFGRKTLAEAASLVGISRARGSHVRLRALKRLAGEVAHLA